MSIRDLRKMGLLKPESEWTSKLPKSSVSIGWTIVWTSLAITGCVLMVQGDGGLMTWVGLTCFVVALVAFVRLSITSVCSAGLE